MLLAGSAPEKLGHPQWPLKSHLGTKAVDFALFIDHIAPAQYYVIKIIDHGEHEIYQLTYQYDTKAFHSSLYLL